MVQKNSLGAGTKLELLINLKAIKQIGLNDCAECTGTGGQGDSIRPENKAHKIELYSPTTQSCRITRRYDEYSSPSEKKGV